MEALVGSLIVLVLSQGALLWYKLGRIESKLEAHCRQSNGSCLRKEGK